MGQSEAVYAHDGTLMSINDNHSVSSHMNHMHTVQDEINQSSFLTNNSIMASAKP